MSIALKPSYSINPNGDTITLLDLTGQYSSINTGGWGVLNPIVSTALVATVAISLRDSDGNYGDVTTLDVFPDLPSDFGAEYEIASDDAGQSDTFPDGIYKITYFVSGNDGSAYSATNTQYKSFHPAIDCCYQKLAAKVSQCKCNCSQIEESFNLMSLNFRLLRAAEDCGNLQDIKTYIDFLTKTCSNCGCGCTD